jgi:aryl-alcohol dehydrogenase-like predicted oxidoreductase
MNRTLSQRRLGPFEVSALGFGCMNVSHAYGNPPPPDEAAKLLEVAFDEGINFFDTAALYGFGANEQLLGNNLLKQHRSKIILASKGGMAGVDGKRVINGRPEAIRKNCEDSLRNLKTDVIDLYYLHRWDKQVPIEESVGAMADLVTAGKVRTLGLSEVSASTIARAHATHPITAVQTEYSIWTRNPEIAVLDQCRELGIAFVAFSPVARGFLGGKLKDVSTLDPKDIRRGMPRFYPENYPRNLEVLDQLLEVAKEENCSIAQLSLAWLLNKGEDIIPIPGTTKVSHLKDNIGSINLKLSTQSLARIDEILGAAPIIGERYNEATQNEIDTETF